MAITGIESNMNQLFNSVPKPINPVTRLEIMSDVPFSPDTVRPRLEESEFKIQWLIDNHLPDLFVYLQSPDGLYYRKVPILKSLIGITGRLTDSQSSDILAYANKLFEQPYDDDIAYHAAELYGKTLALQNSAVVDRGVERLMDNQQSAELNYAPAALRTFIEAKKSSYDFDERSIIDRILTIDTVLTGKNTRVLDLIVFLSKIYDSDFIISLLVNIDPAALSRNEAVRVAYIIHRASAIPNYTEAARSDGFDQDIHVGALVSLRNIHKDPFIRTYIDTIIDREHTHNDISAGYVFNTMHESADQMVLFAATRILGQMDFSNEDRQRAMSLLLNTIKRNDISAAVKFNALIYMTYGNHFLPQLTPEEADKLTNSFIEILESDEQNRRYLPFFISRIYSRRNDFPSWNRHISHAVQQLNDLSVDEQIRYEYGRFLTNFVVSFHAKGDINEGMIKFYEVILCQLKNFDPSLYELLLQKYINLVLTTSRMSDDSRIRYLDSKTVAECLQSESVEPFSRQLTLDALSKFYCTS